MAFSVASAVKSEGALFFFLRLAKRKFFTSNKFLLRKNLLYGILSINEINLYMEREDFCERQIEPVVGRFSNGVS